MIGRVHRGGTQTARIGVFLTAAATGLILELVAAAAAGAGGGSPRTTTTTGSQTSTTSGPVIDLGDTGQILFVVVIIGGFAAVWFALIFYDRFSASRRIYKVLPDLLAAAQGGDPKQQQGDVKRPLSAREITVILSAVRTQPKGTRGLTRTTIALGLLTLVGVALAALLVGNGGNASDLLKTVVTALTAALTTVLGFYFGAKTATDAGAGRAAAPERPGLPGAPANVTVTPGDGSATVTFGAPADGRGSPITGYTVTAYAGDAVAATVSGATSPIVVPGLTNGVEYTFRVRATNAAGVGPESAASEPVTPGGGGESEAETPPAAPVAPSDVTVTPGGATESGASEPVTPGGGGESEAETPPAVPGAPSDVTATPGDGSATVTFGAPADGGGSPITGYTVTAYAGDAVAATVSGATSPIVVPGLTNGVEYTFRVRATNAADGGPESDASPPVTPQAGAVI